MPDTVVEWLAEKLYISMANRLELIAFTKERIHKPMEFWSTVIFSDESKFYIFGIKGRKLVGRKPYTALQKRAFSTNEHLWDLLKRRIHQHKISSKDMLKSVLKDEWEKISTEETTRLVNSMLKQL
ncbi:transposable element Tc1 transposase [Trichonephila clavipes]|nr:transposable element Tc1 transposase [Trichonephila clavipes]